MTFFPQQLGSLTVGHIADQQLSIFPIPNVFYFLAAGQKYKVMISPKVCFEHVFWDVLFWSSKPKYLLGRAAMSNDTTKEGNHNFMGCVSVLLFINFLSQMVELVGSCWWCTQLF